MRRICNMIPIGSIKSKEERKGEALVKASEKKDGSIASSKMRKGAVITTRKENTT